MFSMAWEHLGGSYLVLALLCSTSANLFALLTGSEALQVLIEILRSLVRQLYKIN